MTQNVNKEMRSEETSHQMQCVHRISYDIGKISTGCLVINPVMQT